MRNLSSTTIVLGATVAFLLAGAAHRTTAQPSSRNHVRSISTPDGEDFTSCDQIKIETNDHRNVARSEEDFTVTRAAASPLRVHLGHGNGVFVRGWDRDDYSVRACKGAVPESESGGAEMLKRISVRMEGGDVRVEGPSGDDWFVFILMQAPKNAALDLSSVNGAVGLYEVSGKISAHAENGPVSLKHCTGDIEAGTQNGPVSFSGSGGHLHLRTDNGPIDVSLEGRTWNDGELEAHDSNGPLSLRIPPDYESGVVVEASGYSPMHCSSDACSQAQRTWDDNARRIEFGHKPVVVRMSTVNGPVSVKTQDGSRDRF